MANPYAAFCEDFYVNMRLGSQLALPHNRETLLHFARRRRVIHLVADEPHQLFVIQHLSHLTAPGARSFCR